MQGPAKNFIHKQMKRVRDIKAGDFCYAVSPLGTVLKLEVQSVEEFDEDRKMVILDKGFTAVGYIYSGSLDIHHADTEKLCGYNLLKTLNARLFLEKDSAIEELENMINRLQYCIEKLYEE